MEQKYKIINELLLVLEEISKLPELEQDDQSKLKANIQNTKEILKKIEISIDGSFSKNYEVYFNGVMNDLTSAYNSILSIKNSSEQDRAIYGIPSILSPTMLSILSNIQDHIYGLKLLEPIKDETKNIVLIGPNGSGKSSFANFLKTLDSNLLVVIPAQKNLYMSDYDHHVTHQADREYICGKFRSRDFKQSLGQAELSSDFQNILTALINEHIVDIDASHQNEELAKQTLLLRMIELFEILIPHIKLKQNVKSRIIEAQNEGNVYHFNSLSDGEKAIVYYISSVLLASKDGLVIIDEPETYINPALYKRLWDLLIKERSDCQFVFITHSMDFIVSRPVETTNIYWIKKFSYPRQWDIEKLPNIKELPAILVMELIASRKPILFCEGDYDKLDYRVYNILFSDKYTVHPIGGHVDVINFTKAFNASRALHNNIAIGIIDGDLSSDEHILKLEDESIYSLYFNEIEMLLLWEPLINQTLMSIWSQQEKFVDDKIKLYKSRFFEKIDEAKEQIIASIMKKKIELHLARTHLQKPKNTDEIELGIESINQGLKELLINNYEERLDNIITEQNYFEALRFCSLKEKISRELANQALDSNYIDKAIFKLNNSKDIQDKLKANFFPRIAN